MKWQIYHNDRDIEFIERKNEVEYFLHNLPGIPLLKDAARSIPNLGNSSCEDIAMMLYAKFNDVCYIRVMEDNENGAEIII